MIFDYFELKNKYMGYLINRIRATQAKYAGIMSAIRKKKMFEGNRLIVIREDGSKETLKKREIHREIQIGLEEIKNLSVYETEKKLTDEIARKISEKDRKMFFDYLKKLTDESGNVVNVGGHLEPDHFFQMLERLEIGFDERGEPMLPTFVLHPNNFENVASVLRRIDEEPDLAQRFNEIITLKKEQWRARESNRKLVG